jgi:hypothetical protein
LARQAKAQTKQALSDHECHLLATEHYAKGYDGIQEGDRIKETK